MKMGVLDSLNDRIECFTGLSTKNAESYQVVNYGLGGHYKQHYDAFNIQNVSMTGFRLENKRIIFLHMINKMYTIIIVSTYDDRKSHLPIKIYLRVGNICYLVIP